MVTTVRRNGAAVSAPRPLREVRTRLAWLAAQPKVDRCSPTCAGWFVADRDSLGDSKIQRCDECWSGRPDPLHDADVARLPEARIALREAIADATDENEAVADQQAGGPPSARTLRTSVKRATRPRGSAAPAIKQFGGARRGTKPAKVTK